MYSYHTHSEFCDGKSSIIKFCEKAIELGMDSLAFTSHAPVPFKNTFSIDFNELLIYKKKVLEAKDKYKDQLNIFIGLEADFIPSESISFNSWRNILGADILIGSVHLIKHPENGTKWFIDGDPSNFHVGLKDIFNGDIKFGVISYFEQVRQMILNEKPDIIGHLDKVKMNNQGLYFNTSDSFYLNEIEKTLEVIKSAGSIVEINSRGIYKGRFDETFPGLSVIQQCIEMNIPLTLASDSHHVDDLKIGFDLALIAAKNAGVKELCSFDGLKWISKPISEY